MCRNITEYREYANLLCQEGDFEAAAEYFTAAAHGQLMSFRWGPEYLERHAPEAPNASSLGAGLQLLLYATVCFRLAGNRERAQNHARQGILIVEDARDNEAVFQRTPHQGWCHEVIGDFRLIADLEEYEQSYQKAADRYQGTENQLGWQSEPEFEYFVRPLLSFAASIDFGIDEKTEERILWRSLEERIRYKQTHYPEIVRQILRERNWKGQ